MYTRAFFMIESGQALTLVKAHIAERQRVRDELADLAKSLGVTQATTHRGTGVLLGVVFDGQAHPDFKKPDKKGVSYPRRHSAMQKVFDAQIGYANPSDLISEAFDVPLSVNYSNKRGSGWRCIGHPLTACGFLFMGREGPYAMWVPDVPAEVAAEEKAKGIKVEEPAKSFKLEFEGCKRIEQKDWEILVLQHELAETASAEAPKSLVDAPAVQIPAAAGLERAP